MRPQGEQKEIQGCELRDIHGFSNQSEQDKQGHDENTKICLENPVYCQNVTFFQNIGRWTNSPVK